MGMIPVGNAGFRVPGAAPTPRVDPGPGVGQTLTAVGEQGMQVATQMQTERRVRDQEQGRMALGRAAFEFEASVADTTNAIAGRLRRNELTREEAQSEWRGTVQKHMGQAKNIPADFDEPWKLKVDSVQRRYAGVLLRELDARQVEDGKRLFTGGLDSLGKSFGLPGADTDRLHREADQLAASAVRAGLDSALVAKTLREHKERDWANHVAQRALMARDDVGALRALEGELADQDGTYARGLDTSKRLMLHRSIMSDRRALETRQRIDIDKRERAAERELDSLQSEVATGVPIGTQRWTLTAEAVRGTAREHDLAALAREHDEVQSLLRMPIERQQAELERRRTALETTGSDAPRRDQRLLATLERAVEENLKDLRERPLIAAERRMGQPIPRLNLQEALADPSSANQLVTQMRDRVATIDAMRERFGAQVPMRVLLPHEVESLKAASRDATNGALRVLLRGLRLAIPDDEAYQGAVLQVFADDPISAAAGIIADRSGPVTLATRVFGDDLVASPAEIAETLLLGRSVLRKTPLEKGQDGAGRSLMLPARVLFESRFAAYVGDLYRDRPSVQEKDLQVALAYYAGRAAQMGRLHNGAGDIDNALMEQALAAAIGVVDNVNGQGHAKAPWGMARERFSEQLRKGFYDQIEALGFPGTGSSFFDHYGVRNIGEGVYAVTSAGVPVRNPETGGAIVIDLRRELRDAAGRRMLTEDIPK